MTGSNLIKTLSLMTVSATLICALNSQFTGKDSSGWLAGAFLETVIFSFVYAAYRGFITDMNIKD